MPVRLNVARTSSFTGPSPAKCHSTSAVVPIRAAASASSMTPFSFTSLPTYSARIEPPLDRCKTAVSQKSLATGFPHNSIARLMPCERISVRACSLTETTVAAFAIASRTKAAFAASSITNENGPVTSVSTIRRDSGPSSCAHAQPAGIETIACNASGGPCRVMYSETPQRSHLRYRPICQAGRRNAVCQPRIRTTGTPSTASQLNRGRIGARAPKRICRRLTRSGKTMPTLAPA